MTSKGPDYERIDYNRIAITAYLSRQLMEFKDGKQRILLGLNLGNTPFIDAFLQKMLGRVWMYYPDYLAGRMNEDRLRRFIRLEAVLLLPKLKKELNELYRPDPDDFQDMLSTSRKTDAQVNDGSIDRLAEFAYAVFMSFGSREKLINEFNSAQQLSFEKGFRARVSAIFLNDRFYHELLRRLYPDRAILMQRFENLFAMFSMKKIMENVLSPEISLTDAPTIDHWLDHEREELQSAELHEKSSTLPILFEKVIENRINEIYQSPA